MPSFFEVTTLVLFLQLKHTVDGEIQLYLAASLILSKIFSSRVSMLKDMTFFPQDLLIFSLCDNSWRFLIVLLILLLSI